MFQSASLLDRQCAVERARVSTWRRILWRPAARIRACCGCLSFSCDPGNTGIYPSHLALSQIIPNGGVQAATMNRARKSTRDEHHEGRERKSSAPEEQNTRRIQLAMKGFSL